MCGTMMMHLLALMTRTWKEVFPNSWLSRSMLNLPLLTCYERRVFKTLGPWRRSCVELLAKLSPSWAYITFEPISNCCFGFWCWHYNFERQQFTKMDNNSIPLLSILIMHSMQSHLQPIARVAIISKSQATSSIPTFHKTACCCHYSNPSPKFTSL